MSGLLRGWLARVLLVVVCGGVLAIPALAAEGRKIKNKVDPVYPELAKRIHLSGVVRIEVVITPSGAIKASKVIGGNPVLVEAASDALKKWRFESGPEETTQVLEFHFTPSQ